MKFQFIDYKKLAQLLHEFDAGISILWNVFWSQHINLSRIVHMFDVNL